MEATGTQDTACRQLAQIDEAAAEALAQRTARLRQLQATLVQVGSVGRAVPLHICSRVPGSHWCCSCQTALFSNPVSAWHPRTLQWRGRIVANSNEWQRRNSALAREKEAVLGHHTALKAALAAFRRAQEARLKQMCVS